MEVRHISEFKGGWLAGWFTPSIVTTKDFEVGYSIHPKGSTWDVHYHKIATEITLLIRGRMKVCGEVLTDGAVFLIPPNEVADPEFLEDCEVVVIKFPSCPGDKYVV